MRFHQLGAHHFRYSVDNRDDTTHANLKWHCNVHEMFKRNKTSNFHVHDDDEYRVMMYN